MFAEDEDWLKNFIVEYKAKLAKERLELETYASIYSTAKSQQVGTQ